MTVHSRRRDALVVPTRGGTRRVASSLNLLLAAAVTACGGIVVSPLDLDGGVARVELERAALSRAEAPPPDVVTGLADVVIPSTDAVLRPPGVVIPPSTTACAPGERRCDGRCVNPSNDAENCGACGVLCRDGTCTRGACACSPGAWRCEGRCVERAEDCPCNNRGEGRPCCLGWLRCDGRCVSPYGDEANCGGCGIRCPGVCTWGRCHRG